MTEFAVLPELEEAASLQELVDAVAVTKPPTGADRQAALAAAFKDKDLQRLKDIQENLGGMVLRILDNVIDPEEMGLLDEDQLAALMKERLDQKDLEALLKLRYALIRTRLFNHFTADAKIKGLPEPEWEPAEVEVPSLGRKFVRQGGRAKNIIDLNKLREAMGDDWETVLHTQIIPEHVEYTLDEKKLLKAVAKNPKLMETVRDCVVVGERTVQSFHERKI